MCAGRLPSVFSLSCSYQIPLSHAPPHPSHPVWDVQLKIWRGVKIVKLRIMQFFPACRCFVSGMQSLCVVFVMSSSLAVYWLYSWGIVFAFAEHCLWDCCLGLCNKDYYQREVWNRKERIWKTCFLSCNTSLYSCYNPLFCWYVESNTELPCCEPLKIPGIVMIRLCLLLLIAVNNTKYHFVSAFRTPDFTGVIK